MDVCTNEYVKGALKTYYHILKQFKHLIKGMYFCDYTLKQWCLTFQSGMWSLNQNLHNAHYSQVVFCPKLTNSVQCLKDSAIARAEAKKTYLPLFSNWCTVSLFWGMNLGYSPAYSDEYVSVLKQKPVLELWMFDYSVT